MAHAARKAATLESQSQNDLALSRTNSERSAADKLESESIHEHAVALEEESERDAADAEADRVSSAEFASKVIEEESQAEAHEAEAAAEEAVFDADREKGLAEAAKAVALDVEMEADVAAVSACEFVPGLNLICDVVGGVAALEMETSASRWAAKSVLDISAAAAVKEEENINLAASAALHVQAGEDRETAVGLEEKAAEEMALSEEEAAAAKREEIKADEKLAESENEKALAEEEELKAESEQVESTRWWEKSLASGLAAFWTSILSAFMSLVALLFFFMRLFFTVVAPSVTDTTKYLLLIAKSPKGRAALESDELVTSSSAFLPKFSYFFLHCGIFFTGIVTFCTKFKSMDKLDTRSKGGVILMFAAFVASSQSLCLHILPQYRNINRRAATCILSCTHTMWRAIYVFVCSIAYLLPLIIMETLSLWVVFGHGVFSPNISKNILPLVIIGLLVLVSIHCYLFEIGNGSTTGFGTTINNDSKVFNSNGSSKSQSSLTSEKDSLLSVGSITCDEQEFVVPLIDYQGVSHAEEDVESSLSFETKHKGLGQTNSSTGCKPNYVVTVSIGSAKALKPILNQAQNYFSVLLFPFEVLVLSCMFALVKSSVPTLSKLWPIFRERVISSHPKWVTILTGAAIFIVITAFYWCLHRNNKKKSSNLHAGVFTGESIRTTVQTILSKN